MRCTIEYYTTWYYYYLLYSTLMVLLLLSNDVAEVDESLLLSAFGKLKRKVEASRNLE